MAELQLYLANNYGFLVALFLGCLLQNMTFTWASRSRNSGCPMCHMWASITSNGVWFAMQVLMWHQLWQLIQAQNGFGLILTGIIYTVATTIGSVYAMKILLSLEKGKSRVGAYGKG